MDMIHHIPKTDLARKTRQVIQSVQRGQTVVIDNHGQPEAAIVDIMDYYLLRAVLHFLVHSPKADDIILPENQFPTEAQARVNLVMQYYLQEKISLARTAEYLNLSWFDLRNRLIRLDMPMPTTSTDSITDDINNAQAFS